MVKFFLDTANPGEAKKAYEMGMMDAFITKRVLGGLEEGSPKMTRGLFKRAPFNHQADKRPAEGGNSKVTSFPRNPTHTRRASFSLLPTKSF